MGQLKALDVQRVVTPASILEPVELVEGAQTVKPSTPQPSKIAQALAAYREATLREARTSLLASEAGKPSPLASEIGTLGNAPSAHHSPQSKSANRERTSAKWASDFSTSCF